MLERRLRDALAELNPNLSADALNDVFRRLTRPEGSTLEARNRAFHRMLVNGVTVEHRANDGAVRGAQAQVIDFDEPATNHLLAVNQFTVTENHNTRRPDVVLFVNGLPWASSSSRTRPTRTPPLGPRGSSFRLTRLSCPLSSP